MPIRRFAWLAFLASTSCASRHLDSGRSSPDGGSPDANVVGSCPGVYAGKVDDPMRDDVGVQGLPALRKKVVESRAAFRKYSSAHSDTYRYTRWFASFTGSACKDTVSVTNGVVESITEQVRPDRFETATDWSTPSTYGPDAGVPFCVPAVTMEQLYDDCLNRTLCQDPRKNQLYVVVDARGLLVQCGYFPLDCADDCYEGFGSLLLTTDGADWTKSPSGCCAPSPEPSCCMTLGGRSCAETCDGMPLPENPGWQISFDDQGCASWSTPEKRSNDDCCGCNTGM